MAREDITKRPTLSKGLVEEITAQINQNPQSRELVLRIVGMTIQRNRRKYGFLKSKQKE